jgi:hypothetical protein
MDIRDYPVDILLTVILVISTLVLILRFWQDLTIAVAACLMMLSLGGLFMSMQVKVRNLKKQRDRLRTYAPHQSRRDLGPHGDQI